MFQEHELKTAAMKTIATYDSAAGTFTLEKVSGEEHSRLPTWLNFYRQQMERYPADAANYGHDVEALQHSQSA